MAALDAYSRHEPIFWVPSRHLHSARHDVAFSRLLTMTTCAWSQIRRAYATYGLDGARNGCADLR